MERRIVMASSLTLRIDVRSYWLHARGEGGGADFDLVMERGDDGLPLLRGRHVAGLLRLAVKRAEEWGWYAAEPDVEGPALLLFGGDSEPGCLDVRNAEVAEPLRARLQHDPELKAELADACFRRIASTAITYSTGVALEKHLRVVECAVPLPLAFTVAFAPGDRRAWARDDPGELDRIVRAQERWPAWIETAWPALDEIGGKRTRGFGRLAISEFSRAGGAST
jgi:hypothetical protein